MYFIELKSKSKTQIDIGENLYGESALYILEGKVTHQEKSFEPKRILVSKNAKLCQFAMEANTTVYIFGGEIFPEPRIIHWNFVASEKHMIEEAIEKWKNQEFDKVPGEEDFVPYPNL